MAARLLLVALPVLLSTSPAAAQLAYNYLPGGSATDDGRFVALAGDGIHTLAQDSLTFILAVPPGETMFQIGIFDGDTGGTSGPGAHWDQGSTQLQYALFYDPYQLGSTDPSNLVGVWRGNEVNPVAGPDWTADSATFPDNGWWNLDVHVPAPPAPLFGQSPSGATHYHLCVSYRAASSGGVNDPCTGEFRPADAQPQTLSHFKLRATANISVLSFAFAYDGALSFRNPDPFIIFPGWSGAFPGLGDDYWVTSAATSTYDGHWSFLLDAPVSMEEFRVFDGDFDFGTTVNQGAMPSGHAMAPCIDTDDPDTPNSADFPAFAVGAGGQRLDDSLPEGARLEGGVPSDDNWADPFRRSPCIRWTLTSPGPDGDLNTVGDNVEYGNDNPSSQREWEQFLVSSAPGCDDSPSCDPSSGVCADHCASGLLPPGVWRIDVEGVDLSNLNAWRSDHFSGFCLNCEEQPRPYLVGDTVFNDLDADGLQDDGEAGISGVVVELLDGNGWVLRSRVTGDGGSGYGPGAWESCQALNTGTGVTRDALGLYCFDVTVPDASSGIDSHDYTVRIAASNFLPGGALYEYFAGTPTASLPSPQQTNTVLESGDNVMTYDFGYWATCGDCAGKITRLTFEFLGASTSFVEIFAHRGKDTDPAFSGFVDPGAHFEVNSPPGGKGGHAGTLGTEIDIYVDGVYHVSIHTSCSAPVGPGTVAGLFEVLSGASKEGGPLCPDSGTTAAVSESPRSKQNGK